MPSNLPINLALFQVLDGHLCKSLQQVANIFVQLAGSRMRAHAAKETTPISRRSAPGRGSILPKPLPNNVRLGVVPLQWSSARGGKRVQSRYTREQLEHFLSDDLRAVIGMLSGSSYVGLTELCRADEPENGIAIGHGTEAGELCCTDGTECLKLR